MQTVFIGRKHDVLNIVDINLLLIVSWSKQPSTLVVFKLLNGLEVRVKWFVRAFYFESYAVPCNRNKYMNHWTIQSTKNIQEQS